MDCLLDNNDIFLQISANMNAIEDITEGNTYAFGEYREDNLRLPYTRSGNGYARWGLIRPLNVGLSQ